MRESGAFALTTPSPLGRERPSLGPRARDYDRSRNKGDCLIPSPNQTASYIDDWHVADDGRRVVFSQQTVHFTCSVHWELRDIADGRLLATADKPEACGQIPDPPKVEVPKWGERAGVFEPLLIR